MTHYDHLIIGGGMAADAAAHGIREQDARDRGHDAVAGRDRVAVRIAIG